MEKVGVIGAGTMGIGVTADLIINGYQVILVDISDDFLLRAKKEIINTIRFLPLLDSRFKKVSDIDSLINKIQFSTKFDDLKSSEFIVENVTERLQIKEVVLKEIDKIVSPEIVFGINTSCLSITKLASFTRRPDKVIGIHFMNPVSLKSTVEVMKGYHTTDNTIEITKVFLSQLGKDTVIVEDYPGFVSNRISHLFMNEAAYVYQDQVASADKIDMIFKKCFGHKMGPLETADLIGLDTVVYSLDVLYQSYQDPKFRCCPLLKKMVDAGLLGRKTGKGFYNYT